jgi:hypothetical protein
LHGETPDQEVHVAGSVFLMAGTATVTIEATGELVVGTTDGVRRIVGIPAEALGLPHVEPASTGRPVPLLRWLDEIAFFIPKSIREPFFGDLCEDLVSKAATGDSNASLWWVAVSQVAVLALRWVWSNFVRR